MNRREFLTQLAILVGAAVIPALPQIIGQVKGGTYPGQLWYFGDDRWISIGEAKLKLVEDLVEVHGKVILWDKDGEWVFEKFTEGFTSIDIEAFNRLIAREAGYALPS